MNAKPELPRLLAGLRAGHPIRLADHRAVFGAPDVSGSRRGEFIAMIERSGLLGRGGAGFPAAVKLRAVAESRRGPRYVVVNAGEGEPASAKDELLLAGAPHLVLDGAVLAAGAVGAREVIVCVKSSARAAVVAARAAIAERESTERVDLQLVEIPTTYVAGEESAIVNYLNTGRALPTFVPPRPFERGVNHRPTLIQNVETLAQMALIAQHGVDWFREIGTPTDPGSRLISLGGAVAAPGVYEVPNGISVGSLVEGTGGVSATIQAFLIGGYAGSWLRRDAGAAVQLAHGVNGGIRPGAGIVFALPTSSCGVCESTRVACHLADESAGQCGPCVNGLAAIADALVEVSEGVSEPGTRARIQRWCADVAGRGACGHPDGAIQFIRSALETFADEIVEHEEGGGCPAASEPWLLPLGMSEVAA